MKPIEQNFSQNPLYSHIQQTQIKMKSKKKLIYKLHENINENPFKKIDDVSLRNAGIGSYDFNKLKSIRAISLKGLASDEIQSDKNSSEWRKKYDLKMNMVSIKQQIQQKAQQALICNKKKIVIDKTLINTQSKKLNIRSLLKQKRFQDKFHSSKNKEATIQDQINVLNDSQLANNFDQAAKITKSQRDNLPICISPHPKYQQGHSRNISLPLIKNQKEQTKNSITFISPKQQLDMLVEEQRAKEQILKQIRMNAQEKINKQVLMSIKLKSIQNLERIARSQSEVIKIDKWKEKYGQVKNSEEIKLKEKIAYTKCFLPEIQQKIHKKEQNESPKYLKFSNRYMDSSEDQPGDLQKSQIQLAKYLLNSVETDEPIFSSNSTILHRQYPKIQSDHADQKLIQFHQYYNSQSLTKQQQENIEFWYSQPLKISITQLKKNANKIQQNQNLSAESEKLPKFKIKSQIKQFQNKNIEKSIENESYLNQLHSEITKAQVQEINLQQNLSYAPQSHFKTKSNLHTNRQKGETIYEEPFKANSPINLVLKNPTRNKCKINQNTNILDKIVEDGMPMQWELNRFVDDEMTDFDAFVKNQAKTVEQK